MNAERDVLTTQQAAKLLGLSTTSVQKMVINGELDAWITPGGHRRVFRSSVEQLLNARNVGLAGVMGSKALLIINGAPPKALGPNDSLQGVRVVQVHSEPGQGSSFALLLGEGT